jgi:hypothetical protein
MVTTDNESGKQGKTCVLENNLEYKYSVDVTHKHVVDRDNDSEECHKDGTLGGHGGQHQDTDVVEDQSSRMKKKKAYKLSLTETDNFNERLNKRGVVYVARIPPKMTPTKMKSLLSEFGPVSRVYLVEEDPSIRKRRRKDLGRSGGKRYVEGWIEFVSKNTAKHVAAALNNTSITNHKRNPHYGECTIEKECGKQKQKFFVML